MTSTAEHPHREAGESTGGLGVLTFVGQDIMEVECWTEGDLFFAHALEVDLVACAESEDEVADKLGHMLLDFAEDLASEDHLTDSQEELFHLLYQRLMPPLMKYHRQRRREQLAHDFRKLVLRNLDWGLSKSSTHVGSAQGLLA